MQHCVRSSKTCYRYDLTIAISCTNLLSVYLYYKLHLLFTFAATMLMQRKIIICSLKHSTQLQ